ncbi:hypothetical protein [Desulfosarcina cetonica]|uniref:hypothetical protein n=1 Tax=Desulfosarcina cetonica TaxID=90730 RepID=UPI0006D058B9|nr:hypothetical protein [Desulfosarcina cetonica]
MHDVNFHHQHELDQYGFLGCCKDCRRSLEIIKPHIMAFAERIKQYDDEALRAMSLMIFTGFSCCSTIWRIWTPVSILPLSSWTNPIFAVCFR